MGLADLGEQKSLSTYQIVIYVVLFLISGYMSYRYIVFPEVQKLQSARTELGRQKALLAELEENTRQLNIIANNAQLLDAELVSIRRKVFSEENDVLTFMRSLPDTTDETGNSLMSIVPMKTLVLDTGTQQKTNKETKDQKENEPVAPPTTLPCKLKPIEVSFDGGYKNVISFLDQLEESGQYMTASSMTISGAKDNSSKVSVKTVLNLVQLSIEPRKPKIDVVINTQKGSGPVQATAADQAKSVPETTSKPTTTTVAQNSIKQKPINTTQQVASTLKPVKNTPFVPSTSAKPDTAKPATKTKPPVTKKPSPAKETSVASTVKTSTSASETKKDVKSSADVSTKKTNGAKSANYSVRVGKFDYHENAQKLLNILQSHGYSAWMKTYSHKGKRTYWVYVGTFETKDKAEAFATSMQKELSYIDDYVILGVKNGLRKNS